MTTEVFSKPVIGLEVHAQLLTRSKMFCGCSAQYADSQPNTHACSVCVGMPGALPVINRRAVEYTIMTALALNCEVPELSKFDRKNYSYPDLPKGYQISQYDMPIGRHGFLEYRLAGRALRCGITRVHLEEDTGKLLHTVVDGRDVSLVDYNRSGVPLMEIVSEPDLESAEAAREYFAALRQALMYLEVNDGNLQEGSMRADLNVSLRGSDGLPGTKVEIKNLNSFRAVQRALEFEIERQREVLQSGGTLVQETRGWVEDQGVTVSQRTKEYAHDYRYFPEPDLPPLIVSRSRLEEVRAALPELPEARSARLERDYALSSYTAGVLTAEKAMADFFEAAVNAAPSVPPARLANWVTGDVSRLLNESGVPIEALRLSPASLGTLVTMVEGGAISGASGKQVLDEIFRTGEEPDAIVRRDNLAQIVDPAALEGLVDRVLAENSKLVDTYRAGKTNVFQALMGQAMKASNGKANPQAVREILERKLGQPT